MSIVVQTAGLQPSLLPQIVLYYLDCLARGRHNTEERHAQRIGTEKNHTALLYVLLGCVAVVFRMRSPSSSKTCQAQPMVVPLSAKAAENGTLLL